MACGFALAALLCVPLAIEAGTLLATEDDPVAVTDRALSRAFDASAAVNGIEDALKAKDADLARSFVELADDRHVAVPQELRKRVNVAVEEANSASAHAMNFTRGLITGEPDDVVSLAGTTLGDLFVFGDIRDALREGGRYASGEHYDELVLGLACAGIALTAGTYASFGAAAPVRVGLSAVKAARKTGRIGGPMAAWIGRSLREAVDWNALRRASFSIAEPAVAVRAAREAVKVEKAGGLTRLVGDVGRVQAKAGTQAALDGLKLARNPAEVAKLAKLAEKKGSKTRAILKTLGRGAILLSVASFNLAMWILGAIATLFGLVSSAKAGVERMTQRHLARKRAQRQAHYAAMVAARA
ncbi:MAG: hypothetical protein K2Y27_04485 [Xanthobacteraceae bacterium]|nr:hypothetical protein [Xanthobacteraceae bacterium]